MGVPMSMLRNLCFPGLKSMTTDKIFDRFFNMKITTFEEFHIAFLDACNKFNSVMPGEHYRTSEVEKIKKYYGQWKAEEDAEQKKKLLVEFLVDNIYTAPTDNVVVMTGLIAPPAAMVLKKAGDNVPQMKTFKLHLIPDFVFVPSITCLAVIGAKMVRMNRSNDE